MGLTPSEVLRGWQPKCGGHEHMEGSSVAGGYLEPGDAMIPSCIITLHAIASLCAVILLLLYACMVLAPETALFGAKQGQRLAGGLISCTSRKFSHTHTLSGDY